MGTICYIETSINVYHYTLRNIPEERRYHLICDRSLKSSLVSYRHGLENIRGFLHNTHVVTLYSAIIFH